MATDEMMNIRFLILIEMYKYLSKARSSERFGNKYTGHRNVGDTTHFGWRKPGAGVCNM